MRRIAFTLAGIVCLVLAISGFACNSSKLHTANRAAKQVADDLHEFEAQVEQQYAAGSLSKDEAINLAQLVSQATLADDAFVAKVQTLKVLDASNGAQVTAWFQDLLVSVALLNEQGVLHLKNPQTQQKFALVYQSVNAALSTLQMLVSGLGAKPSPAVPAAPATSPVASMEWRTI